uniref:Proline rich 7 (synaptic) n=1 Tax=Gasterosteus aculeatus TaxID=69293 RepID=G3QC93_GASAC
MVMSQGTYTFLACFAGFWLVWALVVLLCCFCSFLQRRLKRGHDERLREQCLRTVEMEPLGWPPGGGGEPPQFVPPRSLSPPLPLQVPHPMPQANWVHVRPAAFFFPHHFQLAPPCRPGSAPPPRRASCQPQFPDTDLFGKPPCYEEAVLMEDPPPPYSEVLADPRGGTYLKPAPLRPAAPLPPPPREPQDPAPVSTSETSKPPATAVFPERGYSSLIRLPSSQRWDCRHAGMATMPRREPRTHPQWTWAERWNTRKLQGLQEATRLPRAFPLLGRSTAV